MISVERVTKRYGPVTAVDDLSFDVGVGEVVGFLGPNGAGKTTTMRMITGTLQPDEGRILFDGVPITDDLIEAKGRVGYLPEANPLYDEMLVAEYLEHVAELRRLSAKEARSGISDAADETGLDAVFYRPIGECSKGYRQRIGLAAAILHSPEILVLDEPTEGLDPNQRVEIRRLVSDLGRRRTVLLSTHVMQEVEATCSRLVILHEGRLKKEGTAAHLRAERQGMASYVVEAEGVGIAEAVGSLEDTASCETTEVNGRTRLRVEAKPGAPHLGPKIFELARGYEWTLWEMHRESSSLEDVFRDLTSDAPSDASEPENGSGAGAQNDGSGAGSDSASSATGDNDRSGAALVNDGGGAGADDGSSGTPPAAAGRMEETP